MEANFITQFLLPLALGFIMLGMGMSLVPDDFKRVMIYPKAVAIGLFNQLVLLPIVTFSIITLFGITGELAVGFMILSACPGGATSNLISNLANGDTALSITLTAFSSVFTFITVPIIINFALIRFMPNGQALQLGMMDTMLSVILVILVPVALGMYIREKAPDFSIRMGKPVKIISASFLALIIISAIVKERENVIASFNIAGPASFMLNIATLSIGFYGARLFKLNMRQSATIAIETGIQNGTLGIGIAASLLGSSIMTIPASIYSLIMFTTAFVIIYIGNKYIKID